MSRILIHVEKQDYSARRSVEMCDELLIVSPNACKIRPLVHLLEWPYWDGLFYMVKLRQSNTPLIAWPKHSLLKKEKY